MVLEILDGDFSFGDDLTLKTQLIFSKRIQITILLKNICLIIPIFNSFVVLCLLHFSH